MSIRRIVAATIEGKSRVVTEDELSNAFVSVPGFDPAAVWATAPEASLKPDNRVAAGDGLAPPPGGTTVFIATFPPDSVMSDASFDGEAAGAEYASRLPGLADHFEPDNPGIHRTDTIDYNIVIAGELWCELDEGEVHLRAGDVLIQHGTRHAWRNRGDQPATVVFVLVGATPSP